MLRTLPSILDSTPPHAPDGAVARVAREAHTGFATLMQQQADLRATTMRNIDRQAAATGRSAQTQTQTQPGPHTRKAEPAPKPAGNSNTHAATNPAAPAPPAEAAEPAPRSAQASDLATDLRVADGSPHGGPSEVPRAESGAVDRANRMAPPCFSTMAKGVSGALPRCRTSLCVDNNGRKTAR